MIKNTLAQSDIRGVTIVDPTSGSQINTTNPLPVQGTALKNFTTTTISSGTSVSTTIDLTSTTLVSFISPAAWTTASLSIEVSVDNVNWIYSILDSSLISVGTYSAIVANTAYSVDVVNLLPYKYVRLRSGTAASPVNQAANRTFTIITRPFA